MSLPILSGAKVRLLDALLADPAAEQHHLAVAKEAGCAETTAKRGLDWLVTRGIATARLETDEEFNKRHGGKPNVRAKHHLVYKAGPKAAPLKAAIEDIRDTVGLPEEIVQLGKVSAVFWKVAEGRGKPVLIREEDFPTPASSKASSGAEKLVSGNWIEATGEPGEFRSTESALALVDKVWEPYLADPA